MRQAACVGGKWSFGVFLDKKSSHGLSITKTRCNKGYPNLKLSSKWNPLIGCSSGHARGSGIVFDKRRAVWKLLKNTAICCFQVGLILFLGPSMAIVICWAMFDTFLLRRYSQRNILRDNVMYLWRHFVYDHSSYYTTKKCEDMSPEQVINELGL